MERLLQQYIRDMEAQRHLSKYTIKNYRHSLSEWVAFFRRNGIGSFDEVSISVLHQYLTSLERKGFSENTIYFHISALKSFYRYLSVQGQVSGSPVARSIFPKIVRDQPEHLTPSEIQLLIAAPNTSTLQGLRDRAILELIYSSGIHASELVSLDLADIDLDSRQIRVSGLSRRKRAVSISKSATNTVQAYLHCRDKFLWRTNTQAVFLNRLGERMDTRQILNIVKKYARKAGVEVEITPSTLRASVATHLLDNGADVRDVGALMGHTSLDNTLRYTHEKRVSRARLRHSYLKAHPRSQ